MADAASADDRLPWLDTPRPASARPRRRRAPRAHAVAAAARPVPGQRGRRDGLPRRARHRADRVAPAADRRRRRRRAAPAAGAAAAAARAARRRSRRPRRVADARRAAAAPRRQRRAGQAARERPGRQAPRAAPQRRAGARAAPRPPQRAAARAATRRRYRWPAPSGRRAVGPGDPARRLRQRAPGRWRRGGACAGAYPYLATLPRMVTVVSARRPAAPRYYRLRLGDAVARAMRAPCATISTASGAAASSSERQNNSPLSRRGF